ncbi:MAG: hypothetical protein WBE72_06115 [Terracidiphilus sp.]
MDKDRQIRFLIPPFFLLAALLWGAYLSGQLYPYLQPTAQGNDAATVRLDVSILSILGIATLPVGYFIGVVTIMALRVLGFCHLFPGVHHSYELPMSDEVLNKVREHLGASTIARTLDFCAACAFDHAHVRPEIHNWQVRRWNAFNISSQCITALSISVPLAHAFHIQVFAWQVWKWWVSITALIGLFVWQSAWTWLECRRMFEFSAETSMMLRPQLSECSRNGESAETEEGAEAEGTTGTEDSAETSS